MSDDVRKCDQMRDAGRRRCGNPASVIITFRCWHDLAQPSQHRGCTCKLCADVIINTPPVPWSLYHSHEAIEEKP
jgi:hypothetical protein